MLYYYPPEGLGYGQGTVEAVRPAAPGRVPGTRKKPVRFVTLQGLTFRHAARTFMDNKEPLLRSDWTIYRGGARLLHRLRRLRPVGLHSGPARRQRRLRQQIQPPRHDQRLPHRETGANGVAFVGDPKAVRARCSSTASGKSSRGIDRTPGPKTDNYPADCLVEDCLIHRTGRVEKQTAPVEIAMSDSVTVRHCSIYDVPRAGINIGDGCWGGHVIEYCDVFDTVKETGDHGSFNSWGRDRYWGLQSVDLNASPTTPNCRTAAVGRGEAERPAQ